MGLEERGGLEVRGEGMYSDPTKKSWQLVLLQNDILGSGTFVVP